MVAVFITLLLLLIYRIAIVTLQRKTTTLKLVAVTILVVVFSVSAVIGKIQVDSFSETYRQEIMSRLENSTYVLVNQIPDNILDKINNAEDYNSEAYSTLCQIMDKAFPMNVDINRQIYCNILRLDKDGENAYAIAYLDRSIGVYFPLLDQDEIEEVKRLYHENQNLHGSLPHLWNLGVADSSGEYISLKVPIYHNGQVEGVVSLGTDISFIQDRIQEITFQVLLSTIVILMLVWFGIAEAIAWFEGKQIFEKAVESGKVNAFPSHIVRVLIFFIYSCANLSATFLPVWLIKNSAEFQGEELEFMAALPFTVNTFVMGLMALTTLKLLKKLNMKHVLTLGSIFSLYGNFLMFLVPGSYPIVFFGLTMDGIGVGLITNTMYILLTYIKDEEDRQRGFSMSNVAIMAGVNFGMMLGSVLAVLLSQRITFFIVALTWFSLMIMSNIVLMQLKDILDSNNQPEEEKPETIPIRQFLFNKPMMSFIVMIQNTYILFRGFIYFFIPMFCESHGYSEVVVSLLMMVYTEVAMLAESNLSDRVVKLKNNMGMYIAYALNIVALMLFVFMFDMFGLVLAMVIFGISNSFGKTLQQLWFLKQKPAQQYGEDKAMGVYQFTENIGESLGAMVFARIMTTEPVIASVSSFCAVIGALGFGHMVINKKEIAEFNKIDKEDGS